MSSEHHNTGQPGDQPPTNTDVAFESSDINTRTILAYLFYLAISVAAAFFVSVYVFRFTTSLAVDSQTPPPPVRRGVGPTIPSAPYLQNMAVDSDTPMATVHRGIGPTVPNGPYLQGVPYSPDDPQLDLRNKREADEAANEKYGWTDQQAGIAQIPVDEAMKIIVSKGLPGVAAPAAEKKK